MAALAIAGVAGFSAGTAVADLPPPPPPPCSVVNFHEYKQPPATSLQAAVNAARPGDVLQVWGFCDGDTVITKNLGIEGAGGPPLFLWEHNHHVPLTQALDGDGVLGSVLTILPGVKLFLQDVAIENGTGGPGASGSFGAGYTVGGGIDNAGSLTLSNNLIINNTASAGGGIYNEAGASLTSVAESLVAGNTATDPSGGGGGLYMQSGTGNLHELFIHGNAAAGHGGGIYFAGGTLTFSASNITGNTPDNLFVP
ncbi:MAG TPA: hypothetical protein VKT31_11845 [Solirubrobacteraceae bacterium]|nr:hypothetical protein [Solirubrobacteraceae bacterium]